VSERKSLPLGERWDAEDAMVLRIAAERGVSPFEVMFDFGPAPSPAAERANLVAVSETSAEAMTVSTTP